MSDVVVAVVVMGGSLVAVDQSNKAVVLLSCELWVWVG